jgi:hypothetical protein
MSKKKTPQNLQPFIDGQLCYVVYRRFKGQGPYKLILHSAQLTQKSKFTYGSGPCWVVEPPVEQKDVQPIESSAKLPSDLSEQMMQLVADFKTSSNLARKIDTAALNAFDKMAAGTSAVVWDRAANLILHAITKV